MKTKFNSQICTTREQSERLLSLGLRKETADMALHFSCMDMDGNAYYIPYIIGHQCTGIPAWSLHRLLELCIRDIEINIFLSRRCFWLNKPHNEPKRADKEGGIYDGVIDYIEWLIKEGYFNKEYLENEMEEKAKAEAVKIKGEAEAEIISKKRGSNGGIRGAYIII